MKKSFKNILCNKSAAYLNSLCYEISERSAGSEGNRAATAFFKNELTSLGWQTEVQGFNALDWKENGAALQVGEGNFEVFVSPYSLGCDITAEIVNAGNIRELEIVNAEGRIPLLHDELAKEQLMPKNFIFYNPDTHKQIINRLEKSGAQAIICATGRNSAVAGGEYPFPLIEDGDFDIPSVYMTEEEGQRLLACKSDRAVLRSFSERLPGRGFNVIGKKGSSASERIVITAHIDAKKGTPGAIDNGTGVVILLLAAELLKDYSGNKQVEITALNGEDNFAVPGQMIYLSANQNKFHTMLLTINIDGAGYKEGLTAFSFFNLPDKILGKAEKVLKSYQGITEGVPWSQGDHSIFIRQGVPAVAVSSEWLIKNMDSQNITHTSKDNISIVDWEKLVETAEAIAEFIQKL